MTHLVNRVPEGVRAGGQFAVRTRPEPAVVLTAAGAAGTDSVQAHALNAEALTAAQTNVIARSPVTSVRTESGRAEDVRAAVWNARFTEVLRYMEETGSMPTHNPSKPESKRLAAWLNDQRRPTANLSEDRARLLDEKVPGWRDPREAAWQQRLEAVADYHRSHGRLPAAGKESNEVSSYGRWLVYQRKNEHRLPEHRIRALDALDRDWRDPNPVSWARNVERAADVVRRLGHFPTSGAADPEEHRVAEWLSSQRTHRSRMTREQIRELDTKLPGWNRGREQVWQERLEWTAGFVSRNRRFPSQHSANVVEASHAAWVRAQRRTATVLSDARAAQLDEVLPGWRGPSTPSARA